MLTTTTKTVKISVETYNELAKLGKYGDSMDDIISGLLRRNSKH